MTELTHSTSILRPVTNVGLSAASVRLCRRCDKPLPVRRDGVVASLCRCGAWTFDEPKPVLPPAAATVSLAEVEDATVNRLTMGAWWAELFGGGIVAGTTTLIGGEPGGGKSTVSLQIADAIIEETDLPALYLSMEEMTSVIKGRASRLRCKHLTRIIVPRERPTTELEILESAGPVSIVILDSLPYLAAFNEEVAVEVCNLLTIYAQDTCTPILILNHVNKGKALAGLMTLQHAVDMTVYIRHDEKTEERAWQTIKNRNGASISHDLIMTELGLSLKPEMDDVI